MIKKKYHEDSPLLLSVGCLNIDIICNTSQLPARGQRVMSTGINRFLGGMSTNLACSAARLDDPWRVTVELIAPIGNDTGGQWVEQQLGEYGVGVTGLDRISDPHTCHCVILVEDDGERAIVSEPSQPNDAWVNERITLLQSRHEHKHAHVDGHHAEGVAKSFIGARMKGWRTSLDMDELPECYFGADRFEQLTQAFDLIFINRSCANVLTQHSNVDNMSASLLDIANKTDTIVLLTLGADGVRVIQPGSSPVALPAMPIKSVDTTGAGDVFAGVFLSCWCNGLSVIEAARYACIAGALATTASGALGSLPTTADIVAHV